MLAGSLGNKESTCVHPYFFYFLYLIFPVVTFILLGTNPWLPDGSRCNPNLKHLVYVPSNPSDHSSGTADEVLPVGQLVIKPMPCTCKPEFPVIASVIAGIEIFVFILFILNNPLMNAHGKEASEKRSIASYGRFSGAIAYVTIFMASLILMLESSEYCGIPIFFWTLASFWFRFLIIFTALAGYEHKPEGSSATGPSAATLCSIS